MTFRWTARDLVLTFSIDEGPVRLDSLHLSSSDRSLVAPADQPLVEVSALGYGNSPATPRHAGTDLGKRLRYVDHVIGDDTLRVTQEDEQTGLRIASYFEAAAGVRTWTEASMTGTGELELDFLSSLAIGLGSVELELLSADTTWMAENRWYTRPLRDHGLPNIQRDRHHPVSRSRLAVTSTGSWSSGEYLPTAVLLGAENALGWQIEHNGPWHYELGENRTGGYLLLSGPTSEDHQWTETISAERSFTTVPVSLVIGTSRDDVFAALTRQRRSLRPHRDVENRLPVIFNDYMNTLMGDPTTDKLLPLIDAAAAVGVDYFCIDAGWYAEGTWWNTVGAWQPSTTRFPTGLRTVTDRIHEHGMVPGLWLEPEVVGVESPLAQELPDDAFLTRRGVRVTGQGRYLLDLRSEAARKHLDATVDRLIDDFGIGFFKLDNNTMTGTGTDKGGTSLGQGLLEHNRALLSWLDAVQDRHPGLLLENCGSGAMRSDYAMLSRLHLQSTSDQQDPLLYAPIAAAAPASILPEQAGNWAYPRTGTSREEFVFSLVNGILGRMYLSGHLNQMTADEVGLVRSAVSAHRDILDDLKTSTPFWPLGLPRWTDDWIALGLATPTSRYLTVWHRSAGPAELTLPLSRATVEPVYPDAPDGWTFTWSTDDALTVTVDVPEPSARVVRLT
jgi:hypothetical protein